MPLAPATCPPGEDVADAVVAEAAALSTERLEAEITSLAGHIAAATCRFLLYVAEFDRREGWAAWECRSGAHWLMWHCGMNIRTAQDHLRVAHALEHLPQVRAHFAAGILSYSKVRAITRVADADTEDFFLNYALNGTTSHLERAVAGYRSTNELDDPNANDRHARRYFRWWFDDDGMVCFEGRLTPEDAAVVIAAIQAATIAPRKRSAERPASDHDTQAFPQPGDDPKEARQADALVAICTGDHPDTSSRATVVVHVDRDTLTDDADGTCHLQGSTNIAPETARRLACDATTHTIVTGPDGKATLVDKASKTIPPRVRREVDARDHGCCRIPGCGATGHTHAHHIVHRAHHGPNELDNLITLCPFHHRLVHEGGYRIELDDDQVILHRPGRPPLVDAPPNTPTGAPITATNLDLGLHIEPTTIISRWDGTRLTHDDLSWSLAFLNAGLSTP